MEALAFYLLKVHVGISLLYAIYSITVKRELFFNLNRFILLGIILISFCLPLLPSLAIDKVIQAEAGGTFLSTTSGDLITGKEVSRFDDEIQIKRLSGVITSLLMFYLCGVGIFLLKFINQIMNVQELIRSSYKAFDHQTKYLEHAEEITPFSFFNAIVVNADQHDTDQLKQILAHEKAHVNQLHSIDILLAELAAVILWGNPLVKDLKSTIRMNLEFLADKEVLSQGFDKKEYQWSILRPYLKQHVYPLTNQYGSKPKLRIEKMNAKASSYIKLYKYAFIIPVVVFIYMGIAPFHAAALDKIYAMHLIDEHAYHDYLGYYEFEQDKGSYVQVLMKDEDLVMKTLWNNKKIYFRKQSESNFVNMETGVPLKFPRNWDGAVTGLVAFGEDRWRKVDEYRPVKKKSGEGTVISRTSSGGMQVMVYAIEPWANVKHYNLKSAVASP